MLLKILAVIGGILVILSSISVIPFLGPELGLLLVGLAGVAYPIILKVGDYLDNKKMDNSFKLAEIPFLKGLLDLFKKK